MDEKLERRPGESVEDYQWRVILSKYEGGKSDAGTNSTTTTSIDSLRGDKVRSIPIAD